MLFGKLSFIFEVMVYVGLGLPLVNVLLGLIGGIGNSGTEIDTDVLGDAGIELEVAPDVPLEFDIDSVGGELDIGTAKPIASGKGVPLRFNIYCLCLAFVIMGAFGIYALESQQGLHQLLTFGAGAALAVAAYGGLYRFVIYPLKKNDAGALKKQSLLYKHAIVTFRITKDSPGKIQTKDAVGATISYQAELDGDLCDLERINEGEEVVITEINQEQNTCYVTLAQRRILI